MLKTCSPVLGEGGKDEDGKCLKTKLWREYLDQRERNHTGIMMMICYVYI